MALDRFVFPWPEEGLVVAASSVLRSPLGEKVFEQLRPAMLIVDEIAATASSRLGTALAALADRSRQVIVTTAGRPVAWYPRGETRQWTYPLVDNDGRPFGPRFAVRVHDYVGEPDEAALVTEVVDALRGIGYPFVAALTTRPAIHAALLSVIRRIEAPGQLLLWEEGQAEFDFDTDWKANADRRTLDLLWSLVDAFDELPPDRRLEATLEETSAAFREDRPVLVVTEEVRELEYVIAALESDGRAVASIHAGQREKERRAALGALSDGSVLVATHAALSYEAGLPYGTRSIWFTPPRGADRARRWLSVGVWSHEVEIVLLRAMPSTTRADDAVESLRSFLENPWDARAAGGLA
jgi:hypothetical protein